ncbi:hypothetical protein PCANC_18258 [Puccinia coronata f. sp. avenae]|uniref:Uncharacterized protein n=1 Tax=Puccinia coronata f. sp. avenae TaxID=200324 RepID=A0A2N5UQY1_9BASI|nr:hypothetical protein PCANC_18258 [Puccinia coronata f. sp. avenae]
MDPDDQDPTPVNVQDIKRAKLLARLPTTTSSGQEWGLVAEMGVPVQGIHLYRLLVRFTTRWFQLAGIYDPLLVFVYTTDAKSDRRFRRFIDRAKLPSNGRANRIDAMNVVDLSSWLPRRQIVAASTVRCIKIRLIIFN